MDSVRDLNWSADRIETTKTGRWRKFLDSVRAKFNWFRLGIGVVAASTSRSEVRQAQESVRCTINQRLLSLNPAIVRSGAILRPRLGVCGQPAGLISSCHPKTRSFVRSWATSTSSALWP
ncbi:hypothetical protein L596_025653 [Steinernema carpocapsae]|uniref:Uncharacterized protein n=1 Tax=Steinernema carpocapsae TaxID=34508 RepID=A0A4U5M8M0_STECR|nr:hypothetical protein L596_025653 [Steinernema carpocapsae]